jgi:RHS repeat-associated protein
VQRYGFNGKESIGEVLGPGNWQDYGMRFFDLRIGKFLSVDPLSSKYTFYSPYQFSSNSPIIAIDLDGLEGYNANDGLWNSTKINSSAIAITSEEFVRVQNWYKTDGGTNNPDNIQTQKPEKGYFYIFMPYDDPEHPEVRGMGNNSKENNGNYRGPDPEVHGREMAGFWYRQKIRQTLQASFEKKEAGDSGAPEGDRIMPSRDGILPPIGRDAEPFVPGGRGLERGSSIDAGMIAIPTNRSGRFNFRIRNMTEGVVPNPVITVGILRADGRNEIIGRADETGSFRYNLNPGDQLYYNSSGGSNGIEITYSETR